MSVLYSIFIFQNCIQDYQSGMLLNGFYTLHLSSWFLLPNTPGLSSLLRRAPPPPAHNVESELRDSNCVKVLPATTILQ